MVQVSVTVILKGPEVESEPPRIWYIPITEEGIKIKIILKKKFIKEKLFRLNFIYIFIILYYYFFL